MGIGRKVLITGGLGFIGSHVVEHFVENSLDVIYVLDSETYAANQEFKSELLNNEKFKNVKYYKGDIRDETLVNTIFNLNKIDVVIHLAAESHVDNSIEDPNVFADVNVLGTMNLLNVARKHWGDNHVVRGKQIYPQKLFYHISTDEVYGALEDTVGEFTEETPYDPRSPYSASKAASDHMVRAYGNTYKIPYIISNCSNNYGERQHVEKLIPKTIVNILNGIIVPVYGTGSNVRDWLYVKDHAEAIYTIFQKGMLGETYNIGGDNELMNLTLVRRIIQTMNSSMVEPKLHEMKIIKFVEDRKGHDFRYAVNCKKLQNELGWKPKTNFIDGIRRTIDYYTDYWFKLPTF